MCISSDDGILRPVSVLYFSTVKKAETSYRPPSWIYAATERQNELAKTARSVPLLVSFCVVPPRLVLRLVPPSRPASRLVSCRPVAPSYHFVGRGGLAWRPFRLVLLYSPRSCVVLILYRAAVPPRPSRLAMRRNGAVLRFASRVVVGRFLTRYARLVSSCLVGGSVSWRGACRENELTKTARRPTRRHERDEEQNDTTRHTARPTRRHDETGPHGGKRNDWAETDEAGENRNESGRMGRRLKTDKRYMDWQGI